MISVTTVNRIISGTTADCVIVTAAKKVIVSNTTENRIDPSFAVERIVIERIILSGNKIFVKPLHEIVIVGSGDHFNMITQRIDRIGSNFPEIGTSVVQLDRNSATLLSNIVDRISTVTARHRIVSASAVKQIVSGITEEMIVSRNGIDSIVSGTAVYRIVAKPCSNVVCTFSTIQQVITFGAVDLIISFAAEQCICQIIPIEGIDIVGSNDFFDIYNLIFDRNTVVLITIITDYPCRHTDDNPIIRRTVIQRITAVTAIKNIFAFGRVEVVVSAESLQGVGHGKIFITLHEIITVRPFDIFDTACRILFGCVVFIADSVV